MIDVLFAGDVFVSVRRAAVVFLVAKPCSRVRGRGLRLGPCDGQNNAALVIALPLQAR